MIFTPQCIDLLLRCGAHGEERGSRRSRPNPIYRQTRLLCTSYSEFRVFADALIGKFRTVSTERRVPNPTMAVPALTSQMFEQLCARMRERLSDIMAQKRIEISPIIEYAQRIVWDREDTRYNSLSKWSCFSMLVLTHSMPILDC